MSQRAAITLGLIIGLAIGLLWLLMPVHPLPQPAGTDTAYLIAWPCPRTSLARHLGAHFCHVALLSTEPRYLSYWPDQGWTSQEQDALRVGSTPLVVAGIRGLNTEHLERLPIWLPRPGNCAMSVWLALWMGGWTGSIARWQCWWATPDAVVASLR